jgi:hypothetical protein
MVFNLRSFVVSLVASAGCALAAPPPALVNALERLRDQKSYSWEVINADPGPVAQQFETRRGTVTTVQQNISPHIKGCIDRNGDMLIEREWSDGVRLETVIATDGTMITNTPEGWMTEREVLAAIAEERIRGGMSPRHRWLRRADRPEIRRPDQELVPFLKSAADFEASGGSFVVRGRIRTDGTMASEDDDGQTNAYVVVTMNVQGGVVRDYEVKVDSTRRMARARIQIPVSDQRIVIITYLPTSKLALSDDAYAKLKAAKAPARPTTERK